MSPYTIAAATLCLVGAVAAQDTMESIQGAITVTFKPEECETKVAHGDMVQTHYTGTIDQTSPVGEKGRQFDSSVGSSVFEFQVGMGQVSAGWDQGVMGMCVGEKRTLVIPAALGYLNDATRDRHSGMPGAGGDIPGGAILNFEVECIGTSTGNGRGAPPKDHDANLFKTMDTNEDKQLTEEEIAAWFKKEGQELPDGLMDREDADKDGFVTWDEFNGHGFAGELHHPPQDENLFKTMDTNEDKQLTEEEFAAWFKKEGQELPDGLMDEEDADKDGIVTWDEFKGPKGTRDEL